MEDTPTEPPPMAPIEDLESGSSTSRPPPELNPDLIVPVRPTKPPNSGSLFPSWPRQIVNTQSGLNFSVIPIFYFIPVWHI